MVIVLMGVSGSGKTTVGQLLARALGGEFAEGDAFHPPANVEKMRRGIPLDDPDRRPWLETLARAIADWLAAGRTVVLACSALKRSYREILRGGRREVHFVYLKGDADLIRARLAGRRGHYMPASLLDSQLAALEEPKSALTIGIEGRPEEIVAQILSALEVPEGGCAGSDPGPHPGLPDAPPSGRP